MIPVNLAKQSINPHPVEFGDDRMEKKQMADITTITIRDIFLDNLPENVSRRDGEEFWDAWLDEQRGGVGDEMPTPPVDSITSRMVWKTPTTGSRLRKATS